MTKDYPVGFGSKVGLGLPVSQFLAQWLNHYTKLALISFFLSLPLPIHSYKSLCVCVFARAHARSHMCVCVSEKTCLEEEKDWPFSFLDLKDRQTISRGIVQLWGVVVRTEKVTNYHQHVLVQTGFS